MLSQFLSNFFSHKKKNKKRRSPTNACVRVRVRKFPLELLKQQTDFRLTNIMPLPQSGAFPLHKNVLFTNSMTYVDGEARLNCVTWYFHWANAWKTDSTHVVFSREVCFVSVDKGTQRIHEIPLRQIKFHEWCPM